jgi:hypothetical protein
MFGRNAFIRDPAERRFVVHAQLFAVAVYVGLFAGMALFAAERPHADHVDRAALAATAVTVAEHEGTATATDEHVSPIALPDGVFE